MSKSMAIEGVMKLFLMVAVIIVGMSFLLKAFGIDLIEWLKSKFAFTEGIPEDGWALHVKIAREGDKFGVFQGDTIEIWEFELLEGVKDTQHLSESQNKFDTYFNLESYPPGLCTVYFTTERDEADLGNFYYVLPGARIQYGCEDGKNPLETSLKSCVANFLQKYDNTGTAFNGECLFIGNEQPKFKKCEQADGPFCKVFKGSSLPSCYGPSYYALCTSNLDGVSDSRCNEGVADEKFRFSDKSYAAKGCGKEPGCCGDKPKLCNLLSSDEKTKKVDYMVKYGLMCDKIGRWEVCKPDKNGDPLPKSVTVGSDTYKCEQDLDRKWFVWKKQ